MAPTTAAWPHGVGAMAALVREHEWAASPLGAVTTWPSRLKTAVEIVLDTPWPAAVLWGPELSQVYNDRFVPLLDHRHPAALGRPMLEVWPELTEHVEAARQALTSTGAAVDYTGLKPSADDVDGSAHRAWFIGVWTPIRDDDGAIIGCIASAGSTREQDLMQSAMRESEQRFRQFAEASSDVVWVRDAGNLQWEYLSPAFERIYGLDRNHVMRGDKLSGWLALIHEEDRELALANIERLRTGEQVTFSYRILRPSDGEVRWLRNTDFPILTTDGRVQRIGGIGHDETEERQTAERMLVMVHELQHRTRNLIGVVRSIARETVATTTSSDDFQTRFGERLEALSRVQGLLSRAEVEPITIGALVGMELAALGTDGARGRIHVSGPDVRLRSSTVQTLALVIHELATNARKYGALSTEYGELRIDWNIHEEMLDLRWTETGIQSSAVKSAGIGYGRRLIEHALPYSIGATMEYDLTEEGLRCRISLPHGKATGRRSPV